MRHDLPALELELLPLDEGGDDVGDPSLATGGRGKGWALLVGGVVVVLAAAAAFGRNEVPENAAPAPSPRLGEERMGAPTTVPESYAVPGADGSSVLVSGGGWSGAIDVDPSFGEVTSAAAGRGFVVAVTSSGEAIRWSGRERDGTKLGPAELVVPNVRDPALVWLVAELGGEQAVRTVVASAMRDSRAVAVPEGWKVAGANGQGLVLKGASSSVGVAVWDPWHRRGPKVLDAEGRYLASSVRRIAWLRGAELVESGMPYRGERVVTIEETVVGAAYAPDGVSLALVGEAQRDVTPVRFLEADGTIDEGFVVRAATIATFGWTADGDFIADPRGQVEYRYDPNWGLTISDRRRLG